MAPAVLVKLDLEAAWKSRHLTFCRSVTARHGMPAAPHGQGVVALPRSAGMLLADPSAALALGAIHFIPSRL